MKLWHLQRESGGRERELRWSKITKSRNIEHVILKQVLPDPLWRCLQILPETAPVNWKRKPKSTTNAPKCSIYVNRAANNATILKPIPPHPHKTLQWCNNDIMTPLILTYLKLCGLRKLRRWKSSSRLFCSGVPVRRSLYFKSYTLSTRKNCSQDKN